MFGLLLLLFTYFGIILDIGSMFSVLGISIGTEKITGFLFLSSFVGFGGIILGLLVYTIIIVFRTKPQEQDSSLQV